MTSLTCSIKYFFRCFFAAYRSISNSLRVMYSFPANSSNIPAKTSKQISDDKKEDVVKCSMFKDLLFIFALGVFAIE